MSSNNIKDSSVYIGPAKETFFESPFVSSFFSNSLNHTISSNDLLSLGSLVKFVLQQNTNLVDFLLVFYSLLKQHTIDAEFKKFKDVLKSLDKNSYIYISDVIEQLGLIKEGKTLLKEYISNYKYGTEVINEIKDLLKTIEPVDNVLNLYSGLGILKEIISSTIKYKKIDCYDSDEKLNEFNNMLNSNQNIKVLNTDILHSNDIKGLYNLVIADIPENIKNIIYAKLCTKIKDLKIRGTKSEPLVIQLIHQLLKPNGKAIVIVSNSFLFGDSKQHIETRKFIYENSSEIQVISLANKKSILFWTKSLGSTDIKFKNSSNIIIANNEQIKESEYSFYYTNYMSNLINKSITEEWKINNFVNIIPYSLNSTQLQTNVLYSYSNTNFEICLNPSKYDFLFITKDENIFRQEYLNNYLLDYFKSNIDLITKGKTKTLCLEKINNLVIEKKTIEEQNNIISYININKQINNLMRKQILNIEKIRSDTFNSFGFTNFVKLSEITLINNQTDGEDCIGIYKNSSMAGKVFKVTEPIKSDNIYFITPKDNQISISFLYNYLLNKQDQLVELAKINNTVSLSKKNIESFEVPKISHELQIKINETIEQFTPLLKLHSNFSIEKNIFNISSPSS